MTPVTHAEAGGARVPVAQASLAMSAAPMISMAALEGAARAIAGTPEAVNAGAAALGARAAAFAPLGTLRVLPRYGFLQEQLHFTRVQVAQSEKEADVAALFAAKGLTYPATDVFLRAFKRERALEVWVREPGSAKYSLLKEYAICTIGAGGLGPKRRVGDEQVPEGFYNINVFNPQSDYYLSLGLDYPNRADRIRTNDATSLGGSIMIHGGCKTAGCLPMTEDTIKELYWIMLGARTAGQSELPVHIFPARLTDGALTQLRTAFAKDPAMLRFWGSLKESFDYFERERTLPHFLIDAKGNYRVQA
jgi:murein L,D-transpeptidase YafK